jgi:protocatechuate 3,4-dioxygenase beta subunit
VRPLLLLLLWLAAPAALAVDVEGYVYTLDGTPVAKAAVTAGAQRTATDDGGHFTVTAPADSIVSIEVRAADLPPAKVLALAGDPPLTITLAAQHVEQTLLSAVPPLVSAVPMTTVTTRADRSVRSTPSSESRDRVITGVVRVGRRALANAPVTIARISEFYVPPVTVTSDEKGRYRAAVAPGRYAVSAGEGLGPRLRPVTEGRMHTDAELPIVDTSKAKETAADVDLVAAPLITGRVVDANDKPVGRADVLLVMAGRSPLEFFHQPIVRTRPDGRFAVPAPLFPESERVELVVTPPRHSSTRSRPFVLAQAKDTTITLPRFERVTVEVTDRERKPLPGATVTYTASDETAHFGVNAHDVLRMPHMVRRRVIGPSVELFLAAGEYELAGAAPKHQPKTVTQRVVRPVSVGIALEPGHAIRGRVRRGDTAVAGVQVMIRGSNVTRGERGAVTDEHGVFGFDALPRGTYTLGFFKHEEMIDRTVTVDAPAEVDVDLPPTGVLRGRIVDAATREPVREFLYMLEPVTENDTRRTRGMQRGEAAGDGTFTATVPAGTYRLTAAATGFIASEPVEVVITAGESTPIEIALGRGASVTGRVTDEQGKPVSEVHVMIAGDVGELTRSSRTIARMMPLNAQTAEDGTFTITGAAAGPALLIARRVGFVMERRTIEIEPDTRVDITLTRGLSVSGIVTLDGKPVGGAEVTANASAIGSDYQSTTTDERGRFTLEGLVAARYMINVNREQHHAQLDNVDVTERRELTIELDGKGRGVIVGTVSGMPRGGGKAVNGNVFAHSGERGAEGRIESDGTFRIENAPAGTVEVMAHVQTATGGLSSARKRTELAPGQTVRVDLDLTPAIVVTGRVTHGAGRPVARAQVAFSNEATGMASTVTREDGTYEIGLPGPGRYQIFANAEELVSRHYQTVRDVRGSETIDIQMFEQTVEGVVLDANTRQPVAGAIVTLVPTGMSRHVSAEAPADASGRFTMTNTASGPHLLMASARGYAHRAIEVTTGTPEPIRATFELTPASELRIRVVDARNNTPLEAHITLTDARGTFLPLRPARTPDGTEFVYSLAPGTYRLTAVTPGYKEKTMEITAPGRVVVGLE